ncbi:LppX_LprAFG lipoprotein [Spirillospora sp. CA-253888]
MIRRFAAGTAVAAGLTLTLTGCLGDAKGGGGVGKSVQLSAVQMFGKSAEKADKADSYQADATVDARSPQSVVKMEMSMATRIRPDVAMRLNVKSMSMNGRTKGGMEMRAVGEYMYMKAPGLAAQNRGKPWAKISLNEVSRSATGMSFKQVLEQSQQQNPAEQTKVFTTSKDARQVGTENIDGVKTTHYTGTYMAQEALAKMTPQKRAAMEKTLAKVGNFPITFDLWVGDDWLPRKVTTRTQVQTNSVTMAAVFRDYGKPIEVTPPPVSQTNPFKIPGLGG